MVTHATHNRRAELKKEQHKGSTSNKAPDRETLRSERGFRPQRGTTPHAQRHTTAHCETPGGDEAAPSALRLARDTCRRETWGAQNGRPLCWRCARHWRQRCSAHVAKEGLKGTEAFAMCGPSMDLKKQAPRTMETELWLNTVAAKVACAEVRFSALNLTTAEGRGTRAQGMKLGEARRKVAEARREASKLIATAAAYSGKIDQWMDTLASQISKLPTGKQCLVHDETAGGTIEGNSKAVISAALLGPKQYKHSDQSKEAHNTNMVPDACTANINAPSHNQEARVNDDGRARMDTAPTHVWPKLKEPAGITWDTSTSYEEKAALASCLLLTLTKQDDGDTPGIYRNNTLAGL
ncbi:hypothetical protein TRVL_05003 [Trypanosoma vivax]|nr:hypothetical protein TRVL_05003 [Trypanosoma vivax]